MVDATTATTWPIITLTNNARLDVHDGLAPDYPVPTSVVAEMLFDFPAHSKLPPQPSRGGYGKPLTSE